jgi:hypothetical protein
MLISIMKEVKSCTFLLLRFCTETYVQSRAINFGRQGHSLTQFKMLQKQS